MIIKNITGLRKLDTKKIYQVREGGELVYGSFNHRAGKSWFYCTDDERFDGAVISKNRFKYSWALVDSGDFVRVQEELGHLKIKTSCVTL